MSKTYIVSDIHLGYEHTNYKRVNKFFEHVLNNADELILVGDIYDLWRCTYKDITIKEPMSTTHELLTNVIKEVPYTYIKGNHDYDINNYVNYPPINW